MASATRISFKWSEGVEAKDWGGVAKKENLDSVHTELLRLEDAVHSIHLELQHIRRKEEQMRDINGTFCRNDLSGVEAYCIRQVLVADLLTD